MSLDILGISAREHAVYRTLVVQSSADVDDLAAAVGATPVEVRDALRGLESAGMVARSAARPDRYVASPPDIALASLLLEAQARTRRAQADVSELTSLYRDAAPRSGEDVVDVVRGADGVRQRFNHLQASAHTEVLEFVRGSVAVVPPSENLEEARAIERGVAYRFVLERTTLERPGAMEAVRATVERGGQVRLVRSLPTRLLVVDRRIAMVPFAGNDRDQSGGALLLHAGGLLDMATALFEQTWRAAAPLGPEDGAPGACDDSATSPLDEADRDLLRLLDAGLTDRTVAARLGVSVRTVQRQVHALMETAEVDTRFQLGGAAARRGWFAPVSPPSVP